MNKIYRYQRNCPQCDFNENNYGSFEFNSNTPLVTIKCFTCNDLIFVKLLEIKKLK